MKSLLKKFLNKNPESDTLDTPSSNKSDKGDEGMNALILQFFSIPSNFEVNNLLPIITKLLSDKGFFHFQTLNLEKYTILQYSKDNKKGTNCHQLILKEENKEIQFKVQSTTWVDNNQATLNESKISISSFLKDSKETEITSTIFQYIVSLYNVGSTINLNSRYIEEMSLAQQSIIYYMTEGKDTLLAFLEISSLQKLFGEKINSSKTTWYFLLGLDSCYLAGFGPDDRLLDIVDIQSNSIEVKREIGRDTVICNDHQWLTTLSNEAMFVECQNANKIQNDDRVRFMAYANWNNKSKDKESNQVALKLIESLIPNGNPFDQLSLLYLTHASENRQKALRELEVSNQVNETLLAISKEPSFSSQLAQWLSNWNISTSDSLQVIHSYVLHDFSRDIYESLLIPHREIRDRFLKTKQAFVPELICNTQFARHLIHCEMNEEAVTLLKEALESLPDETLSDLLPNNQTDITDESNQHVLKTTILDLLIKALPSHESEKYRIQVTQLHALSVDRIKALASSTSGELKERAQIITQILTNDTNWELSNTIDNPEKITPLSNELLDTHLPHPASREGGIFSSMQQWLADVTLPDYSSIKKYAEQLNTQNHTSLAHIITDIKYAMTIDDLEVYVARGDKATGIECFEASPPFMTIGINHLTEDNIEFLNHDEFRHVAGSEIAHLYYKHTRITSNDVWRGAKDKGFFMIDTFLSIIPAIGVLGNITKLTSVSNILKKATSIGDWADKGKSAIEYSESAVGLLTKKSTPKDEDKIKEQEMLLTSRIMQLTADRTGLVFSGSITNSITSIFKNSATYRPQIDVLKRYGILSMILKKDEKGEFIYQDLAVRLASLFSFYLSEEYTTLRKNLMS